MRQVEMIRARFVLLLVGVVAGAVFGGAWLYFRPDPAPPPPGRP